jgi:DSF synthase
MDLLSELHQFQQTIETVNSTETQNGGDLPVKYTILTSETHGIFNLGGDLDLFARLIAKGDGEGLQRYATACIDVLYPNAISFNMSMTTMTLVQGDALGGGFEAAISSNVVIAERSARFGLPEVLFNLIPGMGAYSFLIRRTSPDIAERLITSGEVLSAQEMYDLGLIDAVVENGEGEVAVEEFMTRHNKQSNAHAALNKVRQIVNPVTYEELIRITNIWVETALKLTERDLLLIKRLVRAQNRKAMTCGDASANRASNA